MKLFRILVLIILFSPIKTYAFDYQSYAKKYLDSVNETKIRNGVCIELVLDMFSNINDKMLVDTTRMIFGEPILSIDSVQVGDIISYDNLTHIVVVYKNMPNHILIADQNRNGDSSGVKIYAVSKDSRELSTCRIFRPIELDIVPMYNEGYDKAFCLKYYTIHLLDKNKMKLSKYDIAYDPNLRPYILDLDIKYNELYCYFAIYYKNNISKKYNGKIYSPREGVSYIKTPLGKLYVEMGDTIRPTRLEKN